MKKTITTSLTLAVLAVDLCAAEGRVTETPEQISIVPSSPRDVSVLSRELVAQLHRLEEGEELLGERRLRDLRIARYHLARDVDTAFDLRSDAPLAFKQSEDILRSCLVKLTRERLEQRLHLDTLDERLAIRWERRRGDRRQAVEDDSERSWRISPRFGLSRDPYIGANVRLRGTDNDIWSRFTIGLRQRLSSGSESVFLQYEDAGRFFRLEQVWGDELAGDQVLLSLRLRL